MDYKVNSDYFEKVLEIENETREFGMNQQKLQDYIRENVKSNNDTVRFFFSGYLKAMEEAAQKAKVELDMTYETLDNVRLVIIALADLQNKNGYDDKRNAVVTMKTLAAYLTLMAVNNHKVKVATEVINKSGSERPDLWGDIYRITLNGKRDSDLLQYAIKGVKSSAIEIDNGFVFNPVPLSGAYKRITRVNLLDYGFNNMIVSYGTQSDEINKFLQSSGEKQSK